MTTIAEFISGTVNESLKKLLQPVGLIPASLFVLLNLAFVYPSARDDGIHLATAFDDLDGATQAAIVALIAFALSYFLLSASSTILDILGGGLIRGSVLHSCLVWIQDRRRKRLAAAGSDWYLSRRFYVPEEEDDERKPLPSSLGNVLSATQGRVVRRYGIDIAALWSQFVATPDLKEVPARGVVEDERASRDILINMAFMLWVFALEGLLYFTLRDHPDEALLSLIAVPAGYLAYRAAVTKAEAWGNAVETLFDLHRDKLHAALKLKPYTSLSTERKVWQRATGFYLGAAGGAEDDVFQTQDAPAVTAIPAGAVTALTPVSAVREGPEVRGDPNDPTIWLRWIEFVVLVARTGKPDVTAAEVLVDDPRVARIVGGPDPLPGFPLLVEPKVVRTNDGRDAFLWRISELATGSAISLCYRLPLFVVEGAGAATPSHYPGVGFAFDPPQDFSELRLASFEAGSARPKLLLDDRPVRPDAVVDGTYVWKNVVTLEERVWVALPEGDQP